MSDVSTQAPRLHAMWQRLDGRSVLSISRSDWDAAIGGSTNTVEFDLSQTPLGTVASHASVVASVAQQLSSQTDRVSTYRFDAQDEPTPINTDHYTVHLDMQSDPRLPGIIEKASTEDNENLRQYLGNNVFLSRRTQDQTTGSRIFQARSTP